MAPQNSNYIIDRLYDLGLEIQKDYPEIDRGCRLNTIKGQVEVVQKDKPDKYGKMNSDLLYRGLQYALSGFDGNDLNEGYPGLISPKEYEDIKQCGGEVVFQKGIGLFALTKEEQKTIGNNSIKYLMKNNSHLFWCDEEEERFLQYRDMKEYISKNRPEYEEIAANLNMEFHKGEEIEVLNV